MTKQKLIRIFFIAFVAFLASLPIFNLYPNDPTGTYDAHIIFAQKMAEGNFIGLPHFLYHVLLIAIHRLIPIVNFPVAGFFIVPFLANFVLAWLLESHFYRTLQKYKFSQKLSISIILSLALMIIAPISLFTYPRLYLGYIGITMYHSITTMLVKPTSIIAFDYLARLLTTSKCQWKIYIYLSIVTVISLIGKPNYIICLLPAVVIVAVYKLYNKKTINLPPIIIGFFFPCLLILAWQYYFTYYSDTHQYQYLVQGGKTSIIFSPFVVMNFYTKNIIRDFLMSIVFPLSVYLLYFKQAKTDFKLNLAWLTFSISVFYTYFLAEYAVDSARISYAGNLLWSGQLGLFILFFYSAIFLLGQIKQKNYLQFLICSFAFCLHLVSGIVYYAHVINTKVF